MERRVDVRITLEKPWHLDGKMNEQPVVLNYGYTAPRVLAPNSAFEVAGLEVDGDDFVDVGTGASNHVPRNIRRVIPGTRIEYRILYGDPEQNGVLVPAEVARLYFGDWRIPKVSPHGTQREFTFKYERDRVALKWGWWKMPQRVNGRTHLSRGQEAADITKVGSVDMPRVLIESVDSRGVPNGRFSYRPWEHFDFDADVVPDQNSQRSAAVQAAPSFTVDELRAMLAAVEAQTAAKEPTKAAKG